MSHEDYTKKARALEEARDAAKKKLREKHLYNRQTNTWADAHGPRWESFVAEASKVQKQYDADKAKLDAEYDAG